MADQQLTVDQFLERARAKAKGRHADWVTSFYQDWVAGHRHNPMLFPLSQTSDQWKDAYQWFVTVESHQVGGDQVPFPAAAQKVKSPQRPTAASMAQTVALKDLATIVIDRSEPPIPQGETQASHTIVLDRAEVEEAPNITGADEAPTVLIDQAPASQGEPIPSGPPEDAGTVIMDQSAEPDQIGDLGTLITGADQPESPAPEQEQPPAPPQDAGTVMMDTPPTAEDLADLDAMIEDETRDAGPQPQAPSETIKKKKPRTEDLDLDLGDLESMTWMEDKE